jgi:hypothetical protein
VRFYESAAVRRETLRQARIAAFRGEHAKASNLYATIGRLYVVEINETQPEVRS